MRMHLAGTVVVAIAASASPAAAHLERSTEFPDPAYGSVPEYRATGPSLVVCAKGSARRISRYEGKLARRNKRLLKRCRFDSIQAAVDAARSGYRILILPGRYTEPASRVAPVDDRRCADDYEVTHAEDGSAGTEEHPSRVPTYEHHLRCPNAHNLIAIVGDTDGDRVCDRLCDLQMEGTGRTPGAVLIIGDRKRRDVIRADRADGIVIRNLTVEQAGFNGIDVVETDGYRLDRILTRWNQAYGILSFTSDHGLYDSIRAHGNGDSGVYPGSAPEGECKRYSTELRNIDSHHNLSGYSGTAGNSAWIHDSRFHHNATGISTDSAVPNHPGFPQDCARIEDNDVYSNNYDVYDDEHDRYCAETRFEERRRKYVCPLFVQPLGTGLVIFGGNYNLVRNNRFWDNWRDGIRLIWVPAPIREEMDPAKLYDTSHGNQFIANSFGVDPDGKRDPNGLDVFWDDQGKENCWEGNATYPGERFKTSPATLPTCPGSPVIRPGTNPHPEEPLCAAGWSPENPNPPGCGFVVMPPEPQGSRRRSITRAGDRVFRGSVVNDSEVPVTVSAADATAVTASGRPLETAVAFQEHFVKSLYAPSLDGRQDDLLEEARMGRLLRLDSGESSALVVGWRGGRAARLRLGDWSLPLR